MTKIEWKSLIKKWNLLKNDKERIKYLSDHKDKLKVVLDNDSSWVEPKDIEDWYYEEEIRFKRFDQWFGTDSLVYDLFEFIGITAEGC